MVRGKLPAKEANDLLRAIVNGKQRFDAFPNNEPRIPYGPNLQFEPAFITDAGFRKTYSLHRHTEDKVLLWGGMGSGKCLKFDTPILMYDGSIKMVQDVEVGDLLMGPDSQPRKVESLARGRENLYEVQPNKGWKPFTCNESHILSLKTSGYRIGAFKNQRVRQEIVETGTVRNISVRDYLSLSKRSQSQLMLYRSGLLEFGNVKTPLTVDPFFLGLWLGDGNSKNTSITTMDPEVVTFLGDYAKSLSLEVHKVEGKSKASTYRITYPLGPAKAGKNHLLTLMQSIGVINNKHIPKEYLLAPATERLKLLAGLLDSDGHLSNGSFFEITQKNENLANQISFLAQSLGFGVRLKETKKHCVYKGEKREGTYFRVSIYGDVSSIPVSIKRKQITKELRPKVNPLVSNFSVKSLGEGDYYGFEVSGPDRLFLLGDFTVTHNSAHLVGLVLERMFAFPGIECIIGARYYTDVKDIIIDAMERLFSIRGRWDHPCVAQVPNDQEKILRLWNGSYIRFIGFDDWERVRGRNAGFIGFEELSQMEQEEIMDELAGRMRSNACPIRQLVCTTNPPDMTHFSINRWNLRQFMEDYTGPRLRIGELCNCQFCPRCMDAELGEFPYDEQNFCTNPKCVNKVGNSKFRGTGIPYKREGYKLFDSNVGHYVEDFCPGQQEYWRVLFSDATGNPHNPAGFMQGLKRDMDERKHELLAKGRVIDHGIGKMFDSYTETGNVLAEDQPFEPERPIYWAHDWNKRPACSSLAQFYYIKDGEGKADVDVHVFDDITLYDTKEDVFEDALDEDSGKIVKVRVRGVGPEHVAQEFIDRYPIHKYPALRQTPIHIIGDVSGLGRGQSPNQLTNFQIVYTKLKEAGYNPIVNTIKKVKGQNQAIPITDRVNNTNWFLRDDKGKHRIKINPKCVNLRMSLQGLKWDQNGRNDVDKQPDKNAAKATDVSKPRLVSHHAEALGYLICQKFNILKQNDGTVLLIIPGEETLVMDSDGNIKKLSIMKKENDLKKEAEKAQGMSILEQLRSIGHDPFDPLSEAESMSFMDFLI